MEALRHTAIETRLGPVFITSRGSLGDGPAVFLLHGAMRSAADLTGYLDAVPNCVLGHLPGHGVPRLSSASVDDWSKAFAVAVGDYFGVRPVILAGESLGALVCLGMGRFPVPCFRSVVAVEPPLTPSWAIRRAALDDPLPSLLSRPYGDLLAACRLPVTVVAGNVPLEPERETETTPSLLTAAERAALTPIVIEGGHNLLAENPAACAAILNDAAQHVDDAARASVPGRRAAV